MQGSIKYAHQYSTDKYAPGHFILDKAENAIETTVRLWDEDKNKFVYVYLDLDPQAAIENVNSWLIFNSVEELVNHVFEQNDEIELSNDKELFNVHITGELSSITTNPVDRMNKLDTKFATLIPQKLSLNKFYSENNVILNQSTQEIFIVRRFSELGDDAWAKITLSPLSADSINKIYYSKGAMIEDIVSENHQLIKNFGFSWNTEK